MHTLRQKHNNQYIQNNSHFNNFDNSKKVSGAGFECLCVWGVKVQWGQGERQMQNAIICILCGAQTGLKTENSQILPLA